MSEDTSIPCAPHATAAFLAKARDEELSPRVLKIKKDVAKAAQAAEADQAAA